MQTNAELAHLKRCLRVKENFNSQWNRVATDSQNQKNMLGSAKFQHLELKQLELYFKFKICLLMGNMQREREREKHRGNSSILAS